MHRLWYGSLANAKEGDRVELDKAESSHLFKTLRAGPGFDLGLMDGHGLFAKAKVLPGREIEILSLRVSDTPARRLHLFIAPPRRQRMDQILRQCAELGIWSIRPMLCERSVSTPDEESVSGRWEDVLREACKQSGNPFLPVTTAPVSFAKAVDAAAISCQESYFGAVSGEGSGRGAGADGDFAWFVGPEGGFTDAEEELMRTRSFKPLRIGRCVLRVETAAVCGVALLS